MGKKKGISIALAAIMALSLMSCGPSAKEEKIEWPSSGLISVLPKPNTDNGRIGLDLDSTASFDLNSMSESDYNDYLSKCKSAGFTIEADESKTMYTAYNSDGYKVRISFYSSMEKISVSIDAPKEKSSISWPTIGCATMIPTPKTLLGKINSDSSEYFMATVEMTPEEFKKYIEDCISLGFTVNYEKDDKYYWADNENGDHISLSYEGNNTVSIEVDAAQKEEAKSEETTEEPAETEETKQEETKSEDEENSSDGGILDSLNIDKDKIKEGLGNILNKAEEKAEDLGVIDPDFKAFMDSYEAFIDEYVDFMKRYSESDDAFGMINEFSEYMSKYAEFAEKADKYGSSKDTMNAAELAYYLEVTARIEKKLLGAAF